MRKEDRVIAAAAAEAKAKAGRLIDATANLAAEQVTKVAVQLHRAGDALNDASDKLAKSAATLSPADANSPNLVD